jgi:hypothetical protein
MGQNSPPVATGHCGSHDIAGDEKFDGFASQWDLRPEALPCERRFNNGWLVRSGKTVVNRQSAWNLLLSGEDGSRSQEKDDSKETGSAEKTIVHGGIQ